MIFPAVFTLGGLTVVVLTKDMLGYSDLVINRGLGAGAVAWMAFYQTVPLASQMLPFAVLVGCLVAFGRLAADHEILILEASGISSPRLLGPTLAFAAMAGTVGLALSLFAAPWASRTLDHTLDELAKRKPSTSLQAGRVHHFGDWRLEAREVSASGQSMKGVMLWMPEISETVFAKAGGLAPDGRGGSTVTLREGLVLLEPDGDGRMLRFDQMRVDLPADTEMGTRSDADRIRGETLAGLVETLRGPPDEKAAIRAEVELHRRFALPMATLVFGLLALPLFLSRAHFSRSGGGFMGIATTVVYYGLVQLGDGLAYAGYMSFAWGVWLPNLVIGAFALFMVTRLTRMTAFGRLSDRPVSKEKRQVTGEAAARIEPRSWALQRYVATRFLQMAMVCFFGVLVAYFLVDILERMSWLSHYGASAGEVLRYYSARIPLLASRVLPMSLLVATALTVSLLAAQGELMAMRACGIPLGRALLPILLICAFMVPVYFALSDAVLPNTNALASYVKHVVIKGRARGDGPRVAAWYRIGDHVYEAAHLDPNGGLAQNITVYTLGSDGWPVARSDASRAWHIGRGMWRLDDPVRTEVHGNEVRRVPAEPFARLGEDVPAEVDTRQLSLEDLREAIREVEAAGHDATALWVDYWSKVAAPIACLLLPALALFFAVSGPPHPSATMTLVVSAVVAVAYVLLTGVGASLGYGGALSPFVAGFASTLFFGVLTMGLFVRLRGMGQSF